MGVCGQKDVNLLGEPPVQHPAVERACRSRALPPLALASTQTAAPVVAIAERAAALLRGEASVAGGAQAAAAPVAA